MELPFSVLSSLDLWAVVMLVVAGNRQLLALGDLCKPVDESPVLFILATKSLIQIKISSNLKFLLCFFDKWVTPNKISGRFNLSQLVLVSLILPLFNE